MGKKKGQKKVLKKNAGQKKSFFSLPVIIGITAVCALAVFFIVGNDPSPVPEKPIRISPLNLIETRASLSPSIFYGRAKLAYQYASEIPEVLDNQFCYCYCRMNFNHKTLLTCYTDDHGANCSICQNEVFRAYQLHKKGLSIEEITKKIDKEFYRKPMRTSRGL